MYHRVRKKMTIIIISAILLLIPISSPKSIETSSNSITFPDDEVDNNIIDFDEEYTVKFNKKYGVPWHANDFNKNSHKYTIINETNRNLSTINYDKDKENVNDVKHYINVSDLEDEATTPDYRVIPLELISTTEDAIISIIESTTEPDLTVIPLSKTNKVLDIKIEQTVTLPSTTESDSEIGESTTEVTTTVADEDITTIEPVTLKLVNETESNSESNITLTEDVYNKPNKTIDLSNAAETNNNTAPVKSNGQPKIGKDFDKTTETSNTTIKAKINSTESKEEDVPIFTELDTEDQEDIPEDYYDAKDVLPTSAPKTDAISVLFGLAGSVVESVVESVAEKVVPKTIFDLFKRMQKQNEALEAERLRSREENGGLGQFGRGILKSLSSGITRPFSQLMAGVKEAGSLDTDRGFVGNVASSVTSVANAANTYLEAFKDKVQAIYPGTVWCGDGHSATARSSSELGLFFFTDTCCRQHDACKIYIQAGETKYGLTNTGLFTRSHCSCDQKFRECLRRTSSLVSAQIGLTYFNVLGPQCFRKSHPIVRCVKRTRITGQKCEEYELDYTKPKMWQWFDNETF